MRVKTGHIAIALVCVVLGIMLSMQFKIIKSGGAVTIQRIEDLTAQIKALEKERNDLREEVKSLETKINQFELSASQTNTAIEIMKKDLENAKLLAGLTDVEGPGIIVTLNDSKRSIKPGEDPNLFLIHDDDLLKVLNELRAAGAEAISLNEQRIVSTTEIRCVGPTINVNSIRFAPPYVFKAIGNPDNLEAALKLRGGVIDTLEYWGIEVSIKKADRIVIPKYTGSLKFEYAKPVIEGASR